jgi:stage II sporulation protein P
VANELEMQYFYTSIYEENTNEGKETFDKSGVTEENDNSDDKNEQESKDKINNNEQSTNEESNMDIENNTDNTENVNGIGKIKDIKVEDLTYEYLMENFYTVVSSTTLKKEDINAEELMAIDMKIKSGNSSPQILIYHTHSQEAFADSIEGDTSTTIVGVGDYLTKLLTEQYGYNVIHITDSFDYVNGVFDRHKAYDYAYEKVAQVLADNPSIEVVIDLHRDGVAETTHLVTEIDGKPTAKIMFFNGISRLNDVGEIGYLYNPYRKENLAFSLQMKVLAEEYYEGFARRNYIQAYQYNLHLRPKSTLIEVGAQTNTLEEELNAMNPLAKILDMTLS